MWRAPIVEEIRQLRQQYASRFNHDLKACLASRGTGMIARLGSHHPERRIFHEQQDAKVLYGGEEGTPKSG